jgi:hypothetical protein
MGGVPVAAEVALGSFDQLGHLGVGKALAGAQLSIGESPRCNCSIFGGWLDQSELRFPHDNQSPLQINCSNNNILRTVVKRVDRLPDGLQHLAGRFLGFGI